MLLNEKNSADFKLDFAKIKYIDIHTHTAKNSDDILGIKSFMIDELYTEANIKSIGIHPWQVEADNEIILQKAMSIFEQEKLIAIGEIGLDKCRKKHLFEEQKNVFIHQLDYAEKTKTPVVIHCVKSFDTLLHILKFNNYKIPMIIHGYNQNEQITKQLLKYNVYFSFGKSLFFTSKQNHFNIIKHDRIFFETDDSNYFIKEIYRQASVLSNSPLEYWIKTVRNNFKNIFGNTINLI